MSCEDKIQSYESMQDEFLSSLEQMGYRILSPDEQREVRRGDETAVLLTTVLREQLIKVNTVEVNSVREERFGYEEIEAGIKALQAIVMQQEYLVACREVYELITQGKVFRQSVGAGYLSFTMHYIDWNNPSRNVYHVARRFGVRKGEHTFYLDYVLFVNGIPFCVIEWSDIAWKGGIEMAIQQQIGYQQTEGIRDLYAYAQLLLAVAGDMVRCATNDLRDRVWTEWHEEQEEDGNGRPVSLLALCKPDRMLELVYRFILFQGKVKVLARYYHYFMVKKIMKQIMQLTGHRREGGVVYQPAGSGKSLTMLFLTRAIRMDETIRNPKIFWVADRVSVDQQLTDLMVRCGVPFVSADTGRSLVALLESDRDVVVTTTLQKFLTAVVAVRKPLESADIFVILEEGQRSQFGEMGSRLGRILPNACFIAMTSFPVVEERIKQRFGEVMAAYSFERALKDRVMLPVLYERRSMLEWIEDQEERIKRIGEDISADFECYCRSNGLKGLVICQNQSEAAKYKAVFDRVGKLNTEIIPGNSKEEDRYAARISRQERADLLRRYQETAIPEILIVSNGVLAGFDISCHVLYVTTRISDVGFMQAVGRLNRVRRGASQGRLIDYQSHSVDFLEQLEGTVGITADSFIQSLEAVFYRLDQMRAEIWNLIGEVPEYGQDLRKLGDVFRNTARRMTFYTCLDKYEDDLRKVVEGCVADEKEKIDRYKADFQCFVRLKNVLVRRFAEKLPENDTTAMGPALPDESLVWAIMADTCVFRREMEEAGGLVAQADTLAYRIKRGVERSSSLELAYREKVLRVLDEIFASFEKTGDGQEYLNQVLRLRLQLLPDLQLVKLPGHLEDPLLAVYDSILLKLFIGEDKAGELAREVARETDRIVRKNIYEGGKIIVDWQQKALVTNRLKRELVDYLIGFLSAGNAKKLSYEEIYAVVEQCVEKAKAGNYENE